MSVASETLDYCLSFYFCYKLSMVLEDLSVLYNDRCKYLHFYESKGLHKVKSMSFIKWNLFAI